MNESSDDLHHIIQNGRDTRTDWFEESSPIEAIATTMTAMANSQGGMILIGIDDQSIKGVEDSTGAVDRIMQAALSCDPPLIIPFPRILKLTSHEVVIAHIPAGMPHVYSLSGRYLQREGVGNNPLNPRELRRLMIERGETSFEAEIAQSASLDDIDWDKAKSYAASLSGLGETNVEKILLKRGCLVTQGSQLRPTNAGILLFGKDPQRYLRSAEITAVRFAGDTMSDTFSRQDITGTLPDQIRRAETFLIDHLRKGVQLKHTMAREENFEYPLEAARELVVNAVAHRDYSISGDGIRLFIFGNRMDITSPGRLPGPVTIDNIKDERFSRNSAIVQVLADMGFIERLGYGVDRVIDLMHQQKLHAPEFQETGGGFRVTLRNQRMEAKEDVRTDSLELHGEFRGMAVNPRQEAAILYLKRGSSRITNSDLQQLCPDVHPETIRRDLSDLVTKDILKKMGEKRGSYYVLNQ